MFEFGARILLAGGFVLFAGTSGLCGFPLALGVSAVFASLALAAYALEHRGLYDGSYAGLHAGFEASVIALVLVDAGRAESLGFLALVPYAWAASRRGAPWAVGGFAVALALVAGYGIFHRSDPPPALLVQAGGVLLLGLALAAKATEAAPIAEVVASPDADLRGRFRALREAYSVLEERSSNDAYTAAIARATTADAMAQSVRDATSAGGAALFAPVDDGWQAVGRAGTVPKEFEAPFRNARTVQEGGATLLFSAGKPVGAVWLPDEARDGLASVSETLAVRLSDRMEAETERRKRRAAELRITLIEGGDSPDAVARAVASILGANSVEFGALGPFGAMPLGRYGPPCALPEALRHETGPGLAGWAAAGAPMVWIADARADERVDGTTALRARTAALALVPLGDGRAYAWAAWHSAGVARPTALTTMKAAEATVVRWLEKARRFDTEIAQTTKLPT